MDAFIKAVRSPIHGPFSLSSKHKKLPDKWGDYQHQDKIWDGVTFNVKYLGNTLVTELDEEGQSYGDSISADAVKTIVSMAKASSKKLLKMSVTVSPNGICVTNTENQQIFTDLDIYRICFCTADRDHPKVFAYIARNRENETMECQAFLCSKRKIAEAITLTVAESFKLAQERLDEYEKRMKEKQQVSINTSTIETEQTTTAILATDSSGDARNEPKMGFDDNFSDLPVLLQNASAKKSNVIIGSSTADPFNMPSFAANVSHSDADKSVMIASHGYATGVEHGELGRLTYQSPSSADELLCL